MSFKIFDLKNLFPKLVQAKKYRLHSHAFSFDVILNEATKERVQNSTETLLSKFFDFEFKQDRDLHCWRMDLPKAIQKSVRCKSLSDL